MDKELLERLEEARLAGPRRAFSPKEFQRQMLIIGLNKYEKIILPLEIHEEYQPQTAEKIIQFPGGIA